MDRETTTSPVGGEDTAAATLTPEAEVETEELEQQMDDDGNPIEEEPEPEDEEIEFDDELKLKVPKEQAQKVRDALLRQADYTRKTQDLAEQRKAFETERTQTEQATREELSIYAHAAGLGDKLQAYQKVDWQALTDQHANNPSELARIQAAYMNFQQTERAHAQAVGALSRMHEERVSKAEQDTAKRIEEGRATLAREIGWTDDLKAKLTDYALGQGLSRDDLSDLEATPAAAKILRDAYEGHQARQKTKAATRHVTAQAVKPAETVQARSSPPGQLDDRQGVDAWMKARNTQVRKRA